MISIIVPMYNCSNSLSRCVNSILSQTESNIDIILIDDGSTDRTYEIASSFSKKDSRISVIKKNNEGVSSARNLGIEYAKGDYIIFIDSDDWVEDNYVSTLADSLNDSIDLVACDFYINSNSNSKKISDNDSSENNEFTYLIREQKSLIYDYLCGLTGKKIFFSVCNKIFRKEIITKGNIRFDETVKIGEDMIFVLNYLMNSREIKKINKKLYHYVISSGSAMNNTKTSYLPLYNQTLLSLKETFLKHNILLLEVNESLNVWSLEALIIILNSKMVIGMKYKEFNDFFNKSIRISNIFKFASECSNSVDIKRNVLKLATKSKKSIFIFILLHLNYNFFTNSIKKSKVLKG